MSVKVGGIVGKIIDGEGKEIHVSGKRLERLE